MLLVVPVRPRRVADHAEAAGAEAVVEDPDAFLDVGDNDPQRATQVSRFDPWKDPSA